MIWCLTTWYALCIWGGYDEDEGEDEGRKATVDHDPAPGWAPEENKQFKTGLGYSFYQHKAIVLEPLTNTIEVRVFYH